MNHSKLSSRLVSGLLAAALSAPVCALMQSAPPAKPTAPPAEAPPANVTQDARRPANPLSPTPPSGTNQTPDIRSRAPQVQTPATISANTTPAIRFDPGSLDLGDLIPEVAKTGTISVTNITDQPVKIIKIQPSCGCTTTSAPPGPIAPGETTKVDITLKPPSHGGKVAKNVTFQMEGHAPQILAVEGFVREYVTVTPEVLDGPASETAPPATVRVTSKDEHKVKIIGTNPDIFAELPTDAATTHDLQLDWAKWNAAGKPAKVSVMTDHPKAAQVSLLIKRAITPRNPADAKSAATPIPANAQIPALVIASRDGNIDKVAEAIKGGADIESVEPSSRRTALHFAADRGDAALVKALLDSKANPNAPDRTGRSPVTVAAEKKHADVLKQLIAAGGNIEMRDQLGGTPVLWASGLGSAETVRILLESGANPNVVDRQGMTPLIWAATIGEPEVVALLIQKGADIKARDTMAGETALIRAVRTGATPSVELLLKKGSDLKVRNNQGMTPFLVACANGDLAKIKMLVDAGADKTDKDSRGWGAIDFARNRLDSKKPEVIAFLEPIVPASSAVAPPQTKDATPPAAPVTPVASDKGR